MALIKKVHHIAIAVPELDNAIAFWQNQLGLPLNHEEDVPSQKSKVAFLPIGESEIEIVSPASDDSGMAKYIEKRGPGLHHICFEVDNIDEMLSELKTKGVVLIDEIAKELPGRKMAFIHPKSANGVLVELYEVTAI
jgi:methylmalonyl-CoA/ethylmalonyl-CoA epimerase